MPDKELYIQKHEAKMDQWKAEMKRYKAKAAETSADVNIEFQKRVEKLQSLMGKQREKLAEMKKTGGDAWEELKKGADSTFKEMETTWNKTVAAFN